MSRTICGFIENLSLKERIKKGTIKIFPVHESDTLMSSFSPKYCRTPSEDTIETFRYAIYEFSKSGYCVFEEHETSSSVRLTLHLLGESEFCDPLAEKVLNYWSENNVRIGRDR